MKTFLKALENADQVLHFPLYKESLLAIIIT